MLKKAKIIMLPTENIKNSVWLDDANYLLSNHFLIKQKPKGKFQHLYIISDDEIKEGDWYLNSLNTYTIHQHFKGEKLPNYGVKKIIASTDKTLTNYSIKPNPNSGETTYIEAIS